MNKTIYILWLQGFKNAPEIINKCVQSWYYYNPDWKIILLDNNNLIDYINLDDYINLSNKKIEKCKIANIIRCILLNKYGGVWTDSTTFCNKPLNDWLPNYINEGFFAFQKPGESGGLFKFTPHGINNGEPERLLSNWFLYAEKNNYIINKWMNATIDFHTNNEMNYPYFIHHHIFSNLYNSDVHFKSIWNNVPKFSANGKDGPLFIHDYGMFKSINEQLKYNIDNKITPLYKLTYKYKNKELIDDKIILYYLYSTIKKL